VETTITLDSARKKRGLAHAKTKVLIKNMARILHRRIILNISLISNFPEAQGHISPTDPNLHADRSKDAPAWT
jgi:hypothetical protein